MIETVRLTTWEQNELKEKCNEINKELIFLGEQPIQTSKLVHIIIEGAIERLEVNQNGKITLS
ncbi:hypothetical protein ACTXGO_08380 [Psychrobacter sp. T6-1]|uniref:hypothetical protein n=1 Tax=Psychrobacter sp. T6-1 TaxID=3457447 RepID=UPI003FD2F0B6